MARRLPSSSQTLPPAHAMGGNGSNQGYPISNQNTNINPSYSRTQPMINENSMNNKGNYQNQAYVELNENSYPPRVQNGYNRQYQQPTNYSDHQSQYDANQRQGAAHPASNGHYNGLPPHTQSQFKQQTSTAAPPHHYQHQPHKQQSYNQPYPQQQLAVPQSQQQQSFQQYPKQNMPQPQSNNNRQGSYDNMNGYQRLQQPQQQLQGPRSYPANDATESVHSQPQYQNKRPQMNSNNSFNSVHSNKNNNTNDIFEDDIDFHVPPNTSNLRQTSNSSNSSSTYALDQIPESQIPSRQSSVSNIVDDSRINALEEKIQQLERALALKESKEKERENSESRTASVASGPSIYTPAIVREDIDQKIHSPSPPPLLSTPPLSERRTSSILETVPVPSTRSSTSSDLNQPPVPPLPPLEQRRSKSFFDTTKSSDTTTKTLDIPAEKSSKLSHEKSPSHNSLIPTVSAGSYDFDLDMYNDEDHLDEEPPPSYAELEQSGSLTYSQSIYRTGFEKAGFKTNEKNTIGGGNSVRKLPIGNAGGSSSSTLSSPPLNLKMKRKLPPPLPEVNIEDLTLEDKKTSGSSSSALTSNTKSATTTTGGNDSKGPRASSFNNKSDLERPTQQFIDAPKKTTATTNTKRTQRLPTSPPMQRPVHSRPTQRFVDDDDDDDDEIEYDENEELPDLPVQPPSSGKKRMELLSKQPPLSPPSKVPKSKEKPLEKQFKIDPRKAIVLPNGMIQPILPSESRESLDSLRKRFHKIRERAYNDYKLFTPEIQFEWAIMLLEALDKPSFISKVSIDAGIRKTPIPLKDLGKEKFLFLNTSIKVLNIIIEKDPLATRARLYLGDIYSGGIHSGIVPKDEIKGYKLFLEAATQQNDPVAYYRVACCLEVGVGTEQNVELAYKYLDRAALLGDPSAMYQLGVALFAGNQIKEPDVKASLQLYEQAIEKLKDPMIMGRDPLIATRNFKNARDILYTLAKIYQTDIELLKLTDKNNSTVINKIDQLKKLGVYQNREKCLASYLEAAKLGHAEAETALGFYYKEGCFPTEDFQKEIESMRPRNPNSIISPSRSIYWYSKAAANNQIYAAMGLAKWYASGAPGVLDKDPEQAFLWMRKAADEGELVEAEYMVAKCFQQGFGCKESIKNAVLYYKKSASKGHHMALQRLKDITGYK